MNPDNSQMMQTIFVAGKPLPELAQLFACDIADDDDYYAVIAYNIAQVDVNYLTDRLGKWHGPRLRGAVFGIGLCPSPNQQIETALTAMLEREDSPLVVAEAIDALANGNLLTLWPKVSPLQSDRSPYVRGATLRYARRALPAAEARQILKKAAEHDKDPIVLMNITDELDELKEA